MTTDLDDARRFYAAAEGVLELWGTIAVGPTDVVIGRFGIAVDPTGAAFGIFKAA